MNTTRFIQQIREFIAKNELDAALRQLRGLLENSPLLDEVLHQSGRFEAIRRHIRLGTVSHVEAALTENQIRAGLLDLLREMENQKEALDMQEGLERFISIVGRAILSDEAKTLLLEASHGNEAKIRTISTKDGWQIQTNNKVLFSKGTPRERILWKDALSRLCSEDLIEKLDTSQKHSETFEMTKKGFEVADSISEIFSSQNQKFGLFTDPRDSQEYKTVELFGQVWLAQNLNFDAGEGCFFYDNDPNNGEKYGRLYTWDSAQRACPPSWRLPSKEEFGTLIGEFGGSKEAYDALIEDGVSGLNAPLGGIRHSDGDFMSIGKYASFWVREESENEDSKAYFFYFDKSSNVSWYINLKAFGHSVRCVKESK